MDSMSGSACFRILGPLEAIVEGEAVVFDRPQHRDLLGLFLLQPNRLITVEQVIEAMWGPAPPKTATAQVHNMVSALRSALRRGPEATPIVRRRSGYVLPLPDEECIDSCRFERMTAAGHWRAALELWRGEPLADVQAPYAVSARPALREKRLLALEALFDDELEQGRHAAAVPELTAAVADNPLREGLVGQLMTALYRCGRQTEALRVFRETRARLAEEHGLDPGTALRELERLVLKASPDLDPPLRVKPEAPAPPAPFVGRQAALGRSREVLAKPQARLAIYGPPGVGKSVLALAIAEELRAGFPDGRLFFDLGGPGGGSSGRDLAGMLLRGLGVDGAAVPEPLPERLLLLSHLASERRLLLLLDNVSGEAQVREVLDAPWHAVLLTSRERLAALENAVHLRLPMLDDPATIELLAGIAPEQTAADPYGAQEIARLCAGLPLAARLAGAKLAAHPHWTATLLAERLADERQRLDELHLGDRAVRASIELSYAAQPPERQRALRALSVLGPAGEDPWLLAAALDITEEAAFDLCEQLVAAQLLETLGRPVTGYRMHDLIRAYARERFDAEEPAGAGAAIAAIAAETFLAIAVGAERSLGWQGVHPCGRFSDGYPIKLNQARRTLPDDGDPAGWLSEHRAGLVAVTARAHAEGLWAHAWGLARAAAPALEAGGHLEEWQEIAALGLDAAERAGEPGWAAAIHAGLGTLYHYREDFARSRESLERALTVWRGPSSRREAAYAELILAMTNRAMGEPGTAIVLESALDTGAAEGDVVLEVEALRCLAWVDRDAGLPEQACARLRRAADLLSKLDEESDRLRGYVLHDLGVMVNDLEDHPAAIAILEKALALFNRLGDRHWCGLTLHRLGEAAEAAGRRANAIERFLAAREVFRAMHDAKSEGRALLRLGCLHTASGEHERAEEFLDRAAAIHHRAGQTLDHAYVQVGLGELYEAQGDYARALEAFERAVRKLAASRGNRWEQRARAGVERISTRRIAPEWVLGEQPNAGYP